jgi:hypothetical protein
MQMDGASWLEAAVGRTGRVSIIQHGFMGFSWRFAVIFQGIEGYSPGYHDKSPTIKLP